MTHFQWYFSLYWDAVKYVLGQTWQLLERQPSFASLWSPPKELQWLRNCGGGSRLHQQQDIQSGGGHQRCAFILQIVQILNFPALFFYSKYFPIWIISDTVHNLYEKNSLMDFWKTNTLTPYNGIQWLLHCNHLKSTTQPCTTVSNGYPLQIHINEQPHTMYCIQPLSIFV